MMSWQTQWWRKTKKRPTCRWTRYSLGNWTTDKKISTKLTRQGATCHTRWYQNFDHQMLWLSPSVNWTFVLLQYSPDECNLWQKQEVYLYPFSVAVLSLKMGRKSPLYSVTNLLGFCPWYQGLTVEKFFR